MSGTRGANDGSKKGPAPFRTSALAAIRKAVTSWALPVAGAAVAILVIDNFLPPAVAATFFAAAFAFFWLPMAAVWAAAGKTVVSIGVWLAPALSLSVAWALGAGPGIGWWMVAVSVGVLVISFFPPASEWWDIRVSRFARVLLRSAQSAEERRIDTAAEDVRLRVWTAAREAQRSGASRLASDLFGIRTAAADLPSDNVRCAQLRRALLRFIDAVYHQAIGASDPQASANIDDALEGYWRALHAYRSRSLLYRIMTLRRKSAESDSREIT